MKMNAMYMVMAAIGGASFNTLLWWNHLPPARHERERRRIVTTFLLSAIPAPFLALGGQEYVFYNYPWTRDYPYLALLGAFLCGAFSPLLMSALRRRAIQKTTENPS